MSSKQQNMANAIRALAMDAVQQANSGHPGMPMGMAEIAVGLWGEHLHHNPKNPKWINRDRFVLSNGHGSMLLYSLLHLTGYDLSMQDLKDFRQLHSKTPGHPEYAITPGVETTTGPLGQGITNAVGMALAEKLLAQEFNKPGLDIVDHYTYVFLGDGCLMEGVSHEACSFAGTLKLNKLIALWDDNGISIDGKVVSPRSPLDALKMGVAMVFQETSLVPTMTVSQNLYLGHEKLMNRLRGVYISSQQFLQSLQQSKLCERQHQPWQL